MKTAVAHFLFRFIPFSLCCQANAASATDLYMDNCAACHGPDGTAHTPIAKKLGVKSLVESKLTLAEIEHQITAGVKTEKGTVKMPAFDEKLGKDEVSTLAAYVKALQN